VTGTSALYLRRLNVSDVQETTSGPSSRTDTKWPTAHHVTKLLACFNNPCIHILSTFNAQQQRPNQLQDV